MSLVAAQARVPWPPFAQRDKVGEAG